MNQDISAGQWKQMRSTLKSWWGKPADDDTMDGRSGNGMPEVAEADAVLAAKAQELGAAAIMNTASEAATSATAVGGRLESVSTYLKEKGYENLAADLTALVRSYPVQALLVGVGLGYLLARSTKG